MNVVWALLKAIEAIIGIICFILHIYGIYNHEVLLHIVFYCGTFFGFTLTAIYSALCILTHHTVSTASEIAINFLGAIMYIGTSLWSMYHAEHDIYLQYLTETEETLHPFFVNCRRQSIAALICGCIYMMHCIFACDTLLTKPQKFINSNDEMDEEDLKTLHLVFICPLIHKKLAQYEWFRKYLNISTNRTGINTMNSDDISMKSFGSSTLVVESSIIFREDSEKTREERQNPKTDKWSEESAMNM